MVTHTAPVKSWGLEPCERDDLSTSTRATGGDGAVPRPPGAGRGHSEVQTLLNSAPRAYGGRHFAGRLNQGATHEQRPSPEAASSPSQSLAHYLQGDCRDRAGGNNRSENILEGRLGGDLGKGRPKISECSYE